MKCKLVENLTHNLLGHNGTLHFQLRLYHNEGMCDINGLINSHATSGLIHRGCTCRGKKAVKAYTAALQKDRFVYIPIYILYMYNHIHTPSHVLNMPLADAVASIE